MRKKYTTEEWKEMCREADSSARMLGIVMLCACLTIVGALVWITL